MRAIGQIVFVVLLTGGLLFAYWEPLVAMVQLWSNVPMYSYGYTVPAISLYLLWTRREKFASLSPRPSRLVAVPVFLLAAASLLVGHAAGVMVVQQLSFLVALLGVALALFGVEYVRAGWAGLAYLLLMVPVWDGLTEPLHWPFQLRSAALGVGMLRAVGVPAHLDGTVVSLPNVTLEVARACSGVNYLVAVAALGLPLAYLYLRGVWRRILLITAAMAVAAFSNGLRVALIGVLAYLEIGSPLHGPFHVLHGLFVAGIGYVVLFGGLRLLGERGPESDSAATPPHSFNRFRIRGVEALAVALLFWTFGTFVRAREVEPVRLGDDLRTLPIVLGRWMGEPLPDGSEGLTSYWPGTDQELRRRYRRLDGRFVDVYVGYFSTQEPQRVVASFRSAELHRSASLVSINQQAQPPISANLVPRLRDGRSVAVFWYEIDGVVETSRFWARVWTAWNSLIRRRSNGAVVMVWRDTMGGGGSDEDLVEVAGFLYEALTPVLPRRAMGSAVDWGRLAGLEPGKDNVL